MDNPRLRQIAKDAGVQPYRRPPAITNAHTFPEPVIDGAATRETDEFLATLRKSEPGYTDPESKFGRHFKTKAKRESLQDVTTWQYTQAQLNAALCQANPSLRVVHVLLSRGALFDLGINLPIALARTDPVLATLVLRNCGTNGVNHTELINRALESLLSRLVRTSQPARALSADETALLSTLLAAGARVEVCAINEAPAFKTVVDTGHLGLLRLLLRSKIRISGDVLSSCLAEAARQGNHDAVATLLAYGADPNFNDAEAVLASLHANKFETAIALLAHTKLEVSRRNLTAALDHITVGAFDPSDHAAAQWLELFLCAGASSSSRSLTRRLATAVYARDYDTVQIIMTYKVSVSDCDYSPLRAAIISADLRMLTTILRSAECTADAGGLIPLLATYFDEEDEIKITQMLIHGGARGDGIDQRVTSLIKTITAEHGHGEPSRSQRTHLNILLEAGANVNKDEGAAIELALAAGNVYLVERLCASSPSTTTLSRSLRFLYETFAAQASPHKSTLVQVLVTAGISSSIPDQALGLLIRYEPCNQHLCEFLIKSGASVRTSSQVVAAASALDDEAFGLLASTLPAGDPILGEALSSAFSNLPKAQMLLQRGCRLDDLNSALITELRSPTSRDAVVTLLLDHGASVDQHGGEPLVLACEQGRGGILRMFLKSHPDRASVASALVVACREGQIEFVELLAKKSVHRTDLDNALAIAVADGTQNRHSTRIILAKLLLAHGATTGHNDGECLRSAIDQSDTELLAALLVASPAPVTLSGVFRKSMQLVDGPIKLEILRIVLSAANSRVPELDEALVHTVRTEIVDESILRLLLGNGASVSYQGGKALCGAFRRSNLRVIDILLAHEPANAALVAALSMAMEAADPTRITLVTVLLDAAVPRGPEVDALIARVIDESNGSLLKLFLLHQATLGSRSASAATAAARRGDTSMLTLLIPAFDHPHAVTTAFEALRANSAVFESKVGLQSARLLLEANVEQLSRDEALLSAVKACQQGRHCEDLVTLLLERGADVNGCAGESFGVAAQHRLSHLILQMLRAGASSITVAKAMPRMMCAAYSETDLIEIVRACFNACPNGPAMNTALPADDNALLLAITHYPDGINLLKTLLEVGYQPPTCLQSTLTSHHGPEEVSVVLWTLNQARNVSKDVLAELIQNFDVQSSSAVTNTTPVISAVVEGNAEALGLLIARHVDLQHVDASGRTALSYASSSGRADLVDQLCAAGSSPDDGSLHEATREMHPNVIVSLLCAGHGPNFSSPNHGSRTAMYELLLYGGADRPTDRPARRREVGRVISTLANAGANLKIQHDGKAAIFLAIDNANPVEIVAALLETDVGERLHLDDGMFIDPEGCCYSPTMYIQRGPFNGRRQHRDELLTLLWNKECPDRCYKLQGVQPLDPKGLPEHLRRQHYRRLDQAERIALREVKDRAHERRHTLMMKQLRELSAQNFHAAERHTPFNDDDDNHDFGNRPRLSSERRRRRQGGFGEEDVMHGMGAGPGMGPAPMGGMYPMGNPMMAPQGMGQMPMMPQPGMSGFAGINPMSGGMNLAQMAQLLGGGGGVGSGLGSGGLGDAALGGMGLDGGGMGSGLGKGGSSRRPRKDFSWDDDDDDDFGRRPRLGGRERAGQRSRFDDEDDLFGGLGRDGGAMGSGMGKGGSSRRPRRNISSFDDDDDDDDDIGSRRRLGGRRQGRRTMRFEDDKDFLGEFADGFGRDGSHSPQDGGDGGLGGGGAGVAHDRDDLPDILNVRTTQVRPSPSPRSGALLQVADQPANYDDMSD